MRWAARRLATRCAGAAACWSLLLLVAAQGQGRGEGGARTVGDCEGLQEALASDATSRIDVNGSVVCDPATFGEALVVSRNLTLAGVQDGPVAASIDWMNGIALVVGGEGSHVVFQDLIFRQRDMGLVNLDITFYDHQEPGSTTFAGVVIATQICPLKISNYRDLVVQFTRPDEQPGEQLATMLDETALLLEDLAIQRQGALWRVCRTVLYCGSDYQAQEALLRGNATGNLCAEQPVQEQEEADDGR